MRLTTRRSGFTLIELLIVMIIIGVLAAVSIQMFWKAKDRGLESTIKSDLRGAAFQQELYFEKNGSYAPDPATLPNFEVSPGILMGFGHADNAGWAGTASHVSLPSTVCGLLIGSAPAGTAGPATTTGLTTCTN